MKIILYFIFLSLLSAVFSIPLESFNETYVEPEYLDMLYSHGRYGEFSKLLQIDDVNLVRPPEGDPSAHFTMNKAYLGMGDILLRPWQREEARQGLSSVSFKWDYGEVPYSISSSYSPEELAIIKETITKWNADITSVRFRRRRRNSDKDYVLFFSGNGCYANLGRSGGPQAISLEAGSCVDEGTILHEMSHTVGITHEHERPDRDKYIRILYENIPQEWRSQYGKSGGTDITVLGEYDYYSLMHYPIRAPQTRKPAFEILGHNVDKSQIGQRIRMTDIDKEKIERFYS